MVSLPYSRWYVLCDRTIKATCYVGLNQRASQRLFLRLPHSMRLMAGRRLSSRTKITDKLYTPDILLKYRDVDI
jgi:hypothetical protein